MAATMADLDRQAADAIAKILTREPVGDPDVIALECVAAVRGLGYRPVIEPVPDWRHGGGLPAPGSEAAELLAGFRARTQEAGDG
jgi:hypothetical protein